jgi:hypothetical protein
MYWSVASWVSNWEWVRSGCRTTGGFYFPSSEEGWVAPI